MCCSLSRLWKGKDNQFLWVAGYGLWITCRRLWWLGGRRFGGVGGGGGIVPGGIVLSLQHIL